jgi:chromosomal replication initiation ATPase DnaA
MPPRNEDGDQTLPRTQFGREARATGRGFPTLRVVAGSQAHRPERKTDLKPLPPSESVEREQNFATLCQFESNALAVRMARLVADEGNALASDGPLFVYGPAGSGKTHVLRAIATVAQSSGARVIDTRELRKGFERPRVSGKWEKLSEKLSRTRILLLDDVHQSAGAKEFQIELFSILYRRLKAEKAVVITSRVSPISLVGFEPRLISIMSTGTVAPMSLGGRKDWRSTLLALLGGRRVPDQVAQYVAEICQGNGHRLAEEAKRLTEAPRIQHLLYLHGFRLNSARKDFIRNEPVIFSQWARGRSGEDPGRGYRLFPKDA